MSDNPEIGRSVDVDGIQTNYHRAGSGPVVLLVHGSGPGVSAWANWRLTIPALAEHFTVIAPDIVGFGFTDRPEGFDYSLESWRAHLLGFADALGLDTFSIVGNSFGGGLAISMAAHAPQRVERLVLMGACGVSFPITASSMLSVSSCLINRARDAPSAILTPISCRRCATPKASSPDIRLSANSRLR